MNKTLRHVLSLSVFIFSMLTAASCGRSVETVSCFPSTGINVILNLNLPAYQNLQYTGGWIYVNEQSAGTRGLIVVRTAAGFKIYDRNAPHVCPAADTTLNVVEDIKIVCPKDNATWILLTGQPTAVSSVAPKTYGYDYQPATNTLSIHN